MNTRLERLNKYYWNRTDIQIVLGIPFTKASELFRVAEKLEKDTMPFRPHDLKVSVKTIFKLTATDERLLRRQIMSEEETQKKSPRLQKLKTL